MSEQIHILVEPSYRSQIESDQLHQAVESTLASLGKQGLGTSIIITTESEVQRLNRDFAGQDHPTDVLSFPAEVVDPDSGIYYLGDVLISFPQALAQSRAAGHSAQEELVILAVHGLLHLLGYNHASKDEADEMFSLQAEIVHHILN